MDETIRRDMARQPIPRIILKGVRHFKNFDINLHDKAL
jgi:hypothetical protein